MVESPLRMRDRCGTGIDTRVLQKRGSVSRRPAQNHCITLTLRSTGTTAKVLVVHSLSPEA